MIEVGSALAGSLGTWAGTTPISYAVRWQRCAANGTSCSNIDSAAAPTYVIQSTDAGGSLRFVVTGSNSVGTLSASSAATAVVPAVVTPPPPPPTSSSPGTFGIAAGGAIEWANDTDLARELDGYKTIGASWLRSDLKWSVVESNRGVFNWSIYDRLVAAAKARGLEIVFTLAYTPSWARPAGASDDKYAPSNPNDFGPFVRAAIARYSPLGVKTYEIWNEPNLQNFWKPAPNIAQYTALLKVAYANAKAADPSVTVLAGAQTSSSEKLLHLAQ